MQNRFFLFILIAFVRFNSFADDLIKIPKEDENYKYYIGISENADSFKDAISAAFEYAVSDAIRDNFGFRTSISSDTYLTESNSQILKRFRQNSKDIELTGFERVDMQVNNKNNKYSVTMLYRYDKKHILNELKRLELNPDKTSKPLNEYINIENKDSKHLGGLQVTTDPPNATIKLNDEPYLKSPIVVLNQIVPGKYKLTIDHPYYETINEDVVILPNEITKIDKTLKPAYGKLHIQTDPEHASVYIDDNYIGKSPIENYSIPAGKKYSLRFEHKNAHPQTFEDLVVEKDINRVDRFTLKLLPAKLKLELNLPADRIFINDQKVISANNIFELSPGNHTIEVTKEGYQSFNENLELEPNETLVQKIDLKKIELEPQPTTTNYSNKNDLFNNWGLAGSAYIDSYSSPFKETSKGTSGFTTEVTFSYYNFGGISYSKRTGTTFKVDTAAVYEIGEIAGAYHEQRGVFLNIGEISTKNFVQIGYLEESLRYNTYLTSGTENTKLKQSAFSNANGRGFYFGIVISNSSSVSANFKLGYIDYRANKSNLDSIIFLALGVGFDLFQGLRDAF